jgi:16S rRNA processing protein RimM
LARRLPEGELERERAGGGWVELGRIEGAWGLRGWVRIEPWTGEAGAAADYPQWWLGAGRNEMRVVSARQHGAKLIARLAGIESPEAAQLLKGATIAVPREALPEPEPGRYYWADLMGAEVVNRSGARLGWVEKVFHNGAHDVIEVAGERKRLLPWVEGVIERVYPGARRIEVDWEPDW